MKCIVIAHYFPPINSSGAKRFQYTTKYWVQSGVDVTVITTTKSSSDGDFTESVPKGVCLYEFSSLGRLKESFSDGKDFVPRYSDKKSIKRKIKDFVMNIFGQIPDPRLPFALSLFFRKLPIDLESRINDADYIIATTPPWSMLLAGVLLKIKYKKKLVIDYRDHFSYCHEMPGGWLAKKLEYYLDKWIVNNSDVVITISEPMKTYYSQFSKDVFVVTNGYDSESIDSARVIANDYENNEGVVIRYMGIVSEGRIPRSFISALNNLSKFDEAKLNKIRIEFFGNAALLKKYLDENYPNILKIFFFYDFVLYRESLKLMIESDYLLFSETSDLSNLSTQGILTTKLFEYLGSGRPVLADISPETLAGSLIKKTSTFSLVSNKENDFFTYISVDDFFKRKQTFVSDEVIAYTRKNQAEKYLEILKELNL
jgi:hypothetical protein